MKILGIDASVNGSGFTLLETNDSFEVTNRTHIGFTKIKKKEYHSDNLHIILIPKSYGDYEYHHRGNIILNMVSKYINLREIDYMGIEDYSFGSVGNTFDIAEFCGSIKQWFYTNNISFKKYSPSTIKQFATGKGAGDKVPMGMAYNKVIRGFYGLSDLLVELENYTSPKADIVDSFWIANLMRYELFYIKNKEIINDLMLDGVNIEAILGGKKKKNTLPSIAHPIISPITLLHNVD